MTTEPVWEGNEIEGRMYLWATVPAGPTTSDRLWCAKFKPPHKRMAEVIDVFRVSIAGKVVDEYAVNTIQILVEDSADVWGAYLISVWDRTEGAPQGPCEVFCRFTYQIK